MRTTVEVSVIGAGVSGLTTAVCVAEAGLTVRVRTGHRPGETTSCVAGAIWGPYFATDDRIPRWSEATRTKLRELAGVRDTGVRLVTGVEASRDGTAPPAWARAMEGFRPCGRHELPDGYATGWWYSAPVVDMPVYLAYLVERLRHAGGELEVGMVGSLEDAVAAAPVTVNCTGIGAATLVPDRQVLPNRGQLVVVDNPGVSTFFIEHDESPTPTYFLPHGPDRVVLGGSAELGRSDLEPDFEISKAIQRRCATIEPLLANALVREHRVGLRPSRPRVRLERVAVGRGQVIHNYGHGGSGVTLSWGCARDVLALVMDCLA